MGTETDRHRRKAARDTERKSWEDSSSVVTS